MVSARIQSNRRNVSAYIGAGIIPGKGGGGQARTRFSETSGGQSLMANRLTRGTPRIAEFSAADARLVFGLSGSAVFNTYHQATNVPIGSSVHNGSSKDAEDWTVRLDNYALGGTSLIDLDVAGGVGPTSQYWWNTQDNTAATGNPLDTANSPGPLGRNWIAGVTARRVAGYPFDLIRWSQGENDVDQAATNGAVYKAALLALFAAIRAANGNATTPIFISKLGRGQVVLSAGAEIIRQIQREIVAEGTNIFFSGEEYPLKFASLTGQTITFASGVSTFNVPDLSQWSLNQAVRGTGIPTGALVSAVSGSSGAGTISISTLVNGVATAATTTQAVTGGTIYPLDGTHPYPGADGVEPLDGPGGTQHDTTEGFYRLEQIENRYIANKLGVAGAGAYIGPSLDSATFVRGQPTITVNVKLNTATATDITRITDTFAWSVFDGTIGTPRTITSISFGAVSGGIIPVILTCDRDIFNTPQVQYARGGMNKANRSLFIFDNSTPFPLPMQAGSLLASAVSEPAYQAETVALAAAMTTPPTVQRKAMIDRRISKLKTAGFWTLKDVDYVLAAADAQAASLNWKNPSANALTITGVQTFAADKGYTGASDASAALNTGYDPSAASLGMTLNDTHLSIYVLTAGTTTSADVGDVSNRSRIIARNSAAGRIQVNSATLSSMTDTQTAPASFMAVRRDASNQLAYRQGALVGTFAVASGSLMQTLSAGKTDRQQAMFSAGRAPTNDAMALAAWQADRDYLQAVAAIP